MVRNLVSFSYAIVFLPSLLNYIRMYCKQKPFEKTGEASSER